MKITATLLAIILLCFGIHLQCFGQQRDLFPLITGDINQTHLLVLTSGDELIGTVLEIDELSVLFDFHGNTIEFDPKKVEQIFLIQQQKRIAVFRKPENFGAERFILSETAFSLARKTAEFKSTYGLLNTVDIGITDNISAGGGVLLPVGLVGRVKFSQQLNQKLRIGAGLQTMLSFIIDPFVLFYPYTNLSLGNPKKFLNFSGGYMVPSNYLDEGLSVFSIGGGIKYPNYWRIFMDNYLFATDNEILVVPTGGASWSKRKNRFEFGLSMILLLEFGGIVPVPYIAYARKF